MVKSTRDSNHRSGSTGSGPGGSSSNPSSCPARSWRFWRNFCCLFGWYPVLVAPVVTAGFLLSLYSSAGCDYVVVDVGFVPSNSPYNESHAQLGFFFYKSSDPVPASNAIQQTLHTGCERYSDAFVSDFIEPDRTWKVSRIMATISFFSSLVSTVLAWLMVVTPLPANACWPTVLLPLVMLSFIAEGSKFLIFDISACGDPVWLPSGVDSEPQTADSCLLGSSAIAGVVSGALFLVSLILVCLYTPGRRQLQPDYGLPSSTSTLETGCGNDEKPADDDETSTDVGPGPFEDAAYVSGPGPVLGSRRGPGSMRDVESSDDGARYVLDDDVYTDNGNSQSDGHSNYSAGSLSRHATSYREKQSIVTEEAVSSLHSSSTTQAHANLGPHETVPERVSESRLSKVKEMERLQASNYYSHDQSEALSKLVSELDQTLSVRAP
jgi:hypothetical protein